MNLKLILLKIYDSLAFNFMHLKLVLLNILKIYEAFKYDFFFIFSYFYFVFILWFFFFKAPFISYFIDILKIYKEYEEFVPSDLFLAIAYCYCYFRFCWFLYYLFHLFIENKFLPIYINILKATRKFFLSIFLSLFFIYFVYFLIWLFFS